MEINKKKTDRNKLNKMNAFWFIRSIVYMAEPMVKWEIFVCALAGRRNARLVCYKNKNE